MHRIDREKVHEILHNYKKDTFEIEHSLDGHSADTEKFVNEILGQNFHYHFHKQPTAERAETLGMIENYTREAVLPPVLTKLVERIVQLERRQAVGRRMMEELILLLKDDGSE